MKDFDEILATEREFKVVGETFRWHDVRPEVLTEFDAEPEEDKDGTADPNAAWKLIDRRILVFLSPEDRKRWVELRKRDENPVTIAQLNEIWTWLLEAQVARPTETPSPSASGRGPTAVSSKAA